MSQATSTIHLVQKEKTQNGFDYDVEEKEGHSALYNWIKSRTYRYLFILSYNGEDSDSSTSSGPSWGVLFVGIIIKWLQVASAALGSGFNWSDTYMGWLRIFSGIFSASEWYFGIGDIYMVIVIILFLLFAMQIGFISFTLSTMDPKLMTVRYGWMSSILRALSSSFNSLLFVPITLILVTTIHCDRLDIEECHSSVHLIFAALSVIMTIWFLGSCILTTATVFPAEKYGPEPLSRVHTYCDSITIIFKFFLVLIWVIIDEESMPWVLNIYMILGTCVILYSIVTFLPYQRMLTNKYMASMWSILTWLAIALLITDLEDDGASSGSLVFYLGSPFLVAVTFQGINIRQHKLEQRSLQGLKYAYEVELKLRFSKLSTRFEAALGLKGATTELTASGQVEAGIPKMSKKELYGEMENFYSEASKKVPHSSFLSIIWARFYLGSYKRNIHRALKLLESAQSYYPKLDQKFCIFKEQETIRLQVMKNSRNRNVIKFLDFERQRREAAANEKIITIASVEFWSEFAKNVPQFKKLHTVIGAIREAMDSTNTAYRKALSIKPNSFNVLTSYGLFLSRVLGDYSQSQKMATKAYQVRVHQEKTHDTLMNVSQAERSRMVMDKNLFDEENLVLALNTEEGKVGEISDANNTAYAVLGYGREELIGKNVSTLMPYPFSSLHDLFLRQHLENGTGKIMNAKRSVLALNKEGFLVPLDIQIQELISKRMKPFLVGALKLNENPCTEYVLVNDTGYVTDISKGIGDLFRIPEGSSKTRSPFPITEWFPLWHESQEHFKEGKHIEKFPSLAFGIIDIDVNSVVIKIRENMLSVVKIKYELKQEESIDKDSLDRDMQVIINAEYNEGVQIDEASRENSLSSDRARRRRKKDNVQFKPALKSSLENLTNIALEEEQQDNLVDLIHKDDGNEENREISVSSGKLQAESKLRTKVFAKGETNSSSLKRFRIVLTLTCLLTIILVVVSSLFITKELEIYKKDLEKTDDISIITTYCSSVQYITEFIRIIDDGVSITFQTRQQYQTDILFAADRIEYYLEQLRGTNSAVGTGTSSPLALVENVLLTEYGGTQVTKGLEDALMLLVANARIIGRSAELVNSTNVHAHYIFENCPNFIIPALRVASNLEIKETNDDYDKAKEESFIILFVAVGLIVIILSTMIIPVIIRTEKSKRRIFKAFGFLPKPVYS